MRADPDRADARAAAAVRDAERLVQVQVRHIGAEPARPGQSDQRVQVGAVDVHLAARGMHPVAHVSQRLLEHPVGGRVGEHDRGDRARLGLKLRVQVTEVDGAVRAALHHHHPQPGQHRAGRVGAVRRLGDQADVPVRLALGPVVPADRQQAGQLALRARVGLHRHRVIPGDLGQRLLQAGDQLQVALGLVGRGERMQVGELRPGDRLHLGRRVQLHGARAQRDHRAVQGQVAVGEPAQVPQHRGLVAVGTERRVGEEPAGAHQAGRQRVRRASGASSASAVPRDRAGHRPQLRVGRRLVAGDLHDVGLRRIQVEPGRPGPLDGRRRAARNDHPDGVEELGDICFETLLLSVAARTAALRCTRRAIAVSPSGPW